MKRMQKMVLGFLAMATLLAVCRVGCAEEPAYPARPIKIVVGFPAGGANDLVARSIGLELSRELHQSVVVENISGAAGTIGAAAVARAQPDGYTLLMGAGAHALAPSMRKSIPYDIVKDFAPISLAAIGTYVLVVNPTSKATTVEELIALAKSKPGALNMASAGVGTPLHLAGVMFQNSAGIELTHIAYRGDADANAAIVAGQVDLLFASLGPTLPLIQSGRLRALAVTSLTRSTVAPDLRTIDEAGLAGYNMGTWWGLMAPAGTPPGVIGKLSAAMAKATSAPSIKAQFAASGIEAKGDTPAEFARLIASEVSAYASVAKAAGIQPE